ncbi:hypothetical protein KCP75_24105 [Salmonella enterica subsp. enterica]|nr:hypothetical protein KCP75_24105 [Salmonella enterica subsp. enterica]
MHHRQRRARFYAVDVSLAPAFPVSLYLLRRNGVAMASGAAIRQDCRRPVLIAGALILLRRAAIC